MVFIQLTMKKFAQVHGSKWQKKILWFSEPCFLHEEYICPSLHHWGIRYSLTCNECITFFLPLVIQNYHLTVFLYIKSLKKVTSGELHLLTFHLLSTCLSLPSSSITFLRKCCRQRSSNHLQIILSTGLFIISILLPWNVRGSLSMFIKWKKEKKMEMNWIGINSKAFDPSDLSLLKVLLSWFPWLS